MGMTGHPHAAPRPGRPMDSPTAPGHSLARWRSLGLRTGGGVRAKGRGWGENRARVAVKVNPARDLPGIFLTSRILVFRKNGASDET